MSPGTLRRETSPARDVQALVVLVLHAAEQDVLVVLGEADLSTARLLVDQAVRALPCPPRQVVVELSGLTFCDLHGLDALCELARTAASADVRLTFRGASRQLQRLHRTAVGLRRPGRREAGPRGRGPSGLAAPC